MQDRTQIISNTCTYGEFLELACKKLNELLPHHYTSIKQSEYIKSHKKNLENKIVLVFMDFSENYSYVIQSEVQSRYWSRESCTLHPMVIYFKNEEGELINQNFCFLTDDLKHDLGAVITFQEKIVNYIKTYLPQIKKIEYVSDGCPAQYKN